MYRTLTATVALAGVLTASAGAATVGLAAAPRFSCSSVSACVFLTNDGSGPGAAVTSASGSGLEGFTSAQGGNATLAGVYGAVRGSNPEGLVFGVLGVGAGVGAGVAGRGYVGTLGIGQSVGVYGQASGTSTSPKLGFGVVGLGLGGVEGMADGNLPGILGFSTSAVPPNAYAIEALDIAGTATMSQGAIGVVAASYVSSSTSAAMRKNATALQLEASTTSATTLLRGVNAAGTSVASLDASGNLVLAGTLVQHGSPQIHVRVSDGSTVTAFGSQTTSPTVDDVGEARLSHGSAFVPLQRRFAKMLDPHAPYLVFVTPEGDSRGLYVSGRSQAGFTIRENADGHSDTSFEFRIVGRTLQAATDAGPDDTIYSLHRALVPDQGAVQPVGSLRTNLR